MVSIEEAAEKLAERQQQDGDLEEKLRAIENVEKGPDIKEKFLKKPIDSVRPGKVAGVDGGVIKKRYSVADITAVRAVAAVFKFTDSGVSAEHIPSKSPEPDFSILESEDAEGLEKAVEAKRLKKETSVAMKATKTADKILMDGSIVPSYSEDDDVFENYTELFDKAGKGNIVGVVEDSYGLKLADIMEDRLSVDVGNLRDTVIMDNILDKGERSFVRRYSSTPSEHPVLQHLKTEDVKNIYTFYVKLSAEDLPLRIDFYGEPSDADTISAELNFLKASERYTVPSPVIEADRRAKIPEKHLKRLEKRFSPDLRRRDRRF